MAPNTDDQSSIIFLLIKSILLRIFKPKKIWIAAGSPIINPIKVFVPPIFARNTGKKKNNPVVKKKRKFAPDKRKKSDFKEFPIFFITYFA